MVVEVGFTVVDPMRVEVEKVPGVMATEPALLTFQERVDVPAEATTPGDAEKAVIAGGGFCTFTVLDTVEMSLSTSLESAQRVVEPFATVAGFHDTE
jgi:hypothetical protein